MRWDWVAAAAQENIDLNWLQNTLKLSMEIQLQSPPTLCDEHQCEAMLETEWGMKDNSRRQMPKRKRIDDESYDTVLTTFWHETISQHSFQSLCFHLSANNPLGRTFWDEKWCYSKSSGGAGSWEDYEVHKLFWEGNVIFKLLQFNLLADERRKYVNSDHARSSKTLVTSKPYTVDNQGCFRVSFELPIRMVVFLRRAKLLKICSTSYLIINYEVMTMVWYCSYRWKLSAFVTRFYHQIYLFMQHFMY